MAYRRSKILAARTLIALTLLILLAKTFPLGASAILAQEIPLGSTDLLPLRVLVLSENRLLSPWYETSLNSFRQAMREEHGRTVSLQWDPINMARYSDPADRQAVLQEYAINNPVTPDLVLTLDHTAVFALEQQERFFSTTPVVAITLEESVLGGHRLPPGFTAVIHDLAPLQTVETALHLFPNLERLAIVIGSSPIEQAQGRSLRQALLPLGKRLQIEWLENLSYEETHDRLSILPKNSAVLFIRFLTDRTGRWFSPSEVVGELSKVVGEQAKVTDAPIFVLWSTLLGTGALGGVLMDPVAEGNLVAEQASLLLEKRPVPPRMLPALPIFDWQVMQRFGLDPSDLPEGSLVRNKPPSMWKTYRYEILIAAVVFFFLMLTILALVINIFRRHRAEAELLAAKEAAEEASRAKDTFLVIMSHELRTPLAVNIGYIELAMRTEGVPEEVRGYLTTAAEAGESLLQLIQQILELRNLAEKKMEFVAKPINLIDCCRETIDLFRPQAEQKELDFSVLYEPGLPAQVLGDCERVQQILFHLIGNAVKFTARGKIEISVRLAEKNPVEGQWKVLFQIRDTGIGMSVEIIERLFRPFSQADISLTRPFGGAGVGLAISKGLVEQMGGEIWVESEEGRGSLFSFSLPFRIAEAEKSVVAVRPEEPAAVRDYKANILVVEDEPSVSDLLRLLLVRRGWHVATAENGRKALEILDREPIDLILMDLKMPVMDGFEATRRIRQWERGVDRSSP